MMRVVVGLDASASSRVAHGFVTSVTWPRGSSFVLVDRFRRRRRLGDQDPGRRVVQRVHAIDAPSRSPGRAGRVCGAPAPCGPRRRAARRGRSGGPGPARQRLERGCRPHRRWQSWPRGGSQRDRGIYVRGPDRPCAMPRPHRTAAVNEPGHGCDRRVAEREGDPGHPRAVAVCATSPHRRGERGAAIGRLDRLHGDGLGADAGVRI